MESSGSSTLMDLFLLTYGSSADESAISRASIRRICTLSVNLAERLIAAIQLFYQMKFILSCMSLMVSTLSITFCTDSSICASISFSSHSLMNSNAAWSDGPS